MKNRNRLIIKSLSLVSLFLLSTLPAWAQGGRVQWVPPADWFTYLVIFIVLIGSLLTIMIIRNSLSSADWSISDALSESAEVTATDADGNTIMDASKKPLMIKKLCASSSRMIALMGMIVILLMFLGFGAFALFAFAKTGQIPRSIDEVVSYLLAGLTLFAPYVVNKFSKVFDSLAPKK